MESRTYQPILTRLPPEEGRSSLECARLMLPDAERCGIDIEDTSVALMNCLDVDLLALHARLTAQQDANEAADEVLGRDQELLEDCLDKFQELVDEFRK